MFHTKRAFVRNVPVFHFYVKQNDKKSKKSFAQAWKRVLLGMILSVLLRLNYKIEDL